jgi:hypothetical protein
MFEAPFPPGMTPAVAPTRVKFLCRSAVPVHPETTLRLSDDASHVALAGTVRIYAIRKSRPRIGSVPPSWPPGWSCGVRAVWAIPARSDVEQLSEIAYSQRIQALLIGTGERVLRGPGPHRHLQCS